MAPFLKKYKFKTQVMNRLLEISKQAKAFGSIC